MATARTEAQQLASRLNGQKSKGPKTAEGKAISARNAFKHGLNSTDVVLWCENKDEYKLCLEALLREWQPQSLTEHQLVAAIAQSSWRLRRLITIETASIDLQMARTEESFDELLPGSDEETRLALAWQGLAVQNRTLGELQRHETHLRRTVERSISKLLALGEARRKQAAAQPNPSPNYEIEPDAPEPNNVGDELAPNQTETCENGPGPAVVVQEETAPGAASSNANVENEPEPVDEHQQHASAAEYGTADPATTQAHRNCRNEPEPPQPPDAAPEPKPLLQPHVTRFTGTHILVAADWPWITSG